jgi:hypothetical protein
VKRTCEKCHSVGGSQRDLDTLAGPARRLLLGGAGPSYAERKPVAAVSAARSGTSITARQINHVRTAACNLTRSSSTRGADRPLEYEKKANLDPSSRRA